MPEKEHTEAEEEPADESPDGPASDPSALIAGGWRRDREHGNEHRQGVRNA